MNYTVIAILFSTLILAAAFSIRRPVLYDYFSLEKAEGIAYASAYNYLAAKSRGGSSSIPEGCVPVNVTIEPSWKELHMSCNISGMRFQVRAYLGAELLGVFASYPYTRIRFAVYSDVPVSLSFSLPAEEEQPGIYVATSTAASGNLTIVDERGIEVTLEWNSTTP